MRVIIEVDNVKELGEALDMVGNRPVTIVEASGRAPTNREMLLREIAQKYSGHLPPDWKFDRDEAHER